VPALDVDDVVDPADVGMRDLAGQPDFGIETFAGNSVAREALRQKFQCDRLSELQVVRPIDLPHSPAAEETDHAIPVGEDGAGGEAAGVDRVGGCESADRGR
jgi:hypothetical protein